jgi:MarR family transcriptional repressor of emrRAB
MALARRPPSPERYETARRLITSRVRGTDPGAIDVCLTLWRFSDELSSSFEAFYASHELSRARGHVLIQLLDAPKGLTPAQLADRCGATPANMTGLLRSLQREGLIRRERIAGDRRSQCILLTPAGRRRVQALLPALARRLARIAGALTPVQRRTMGEACRRICAATKELPERNGPGPRLRGRGSVRR